MKILMIFTNNPYKSLDLNNVDTHNNMLINADYTMSLVRSILFFAVPIVVIITIYNAIKLYSKNKIPEMVTTICFGFILCFLVANPSLFLAIGEQICGFIGKVVQTGLDTTQNTNNGGMEL